MSFKVGDVCIGQNLVIDTHHNGVECVITEPLQITSWGECYMVRWIDMEHDIYAYPRTLRLKRPPNKDEFVAGEWELCPWRPVKERA